MTRIPKSCGGAEADSSSTQGCFKTTPLYTEWTECVSLNGPKAYNCRVKTIAWLLFACLPVCAVTLVKDGHSAYSICLAQHASPSEHRGADELQRFVAQMSGARLPIVPRCEG